MKDKNILTLITLILPFMVLYQIYTYNITNDSPYTRECFVINNDDYNSNIKLIDKNRPNDFTFIVRVKWVDTNKYEDLIQSYTTCLNLHKGDIMSFNCTQKGISPSSLMISLNVFIFLLEFCIVVFFLYFIQNY